MIRYFARLNPERASHLLNRAEVLQVDDRGAQLGFAFSALNERGFFKDPEESPLAPGTLPLLTWPFLDFLDHLDLKQSALVELGAGNSTLWFAERFGEVRSFETDPAFHRALAPRVPANVKLELTATGTLESADIAYGGEGWMLVDFAGKRTSFLHHFLAKVRRAEAPSAIVLDNADWFRRGAAILRDHGYLEIPFYGFKSGQLWLSCTSLFIDRERFAPVQKQPFYSPAFARHVQNDWDSP
jgi:hypothetical protein